MRAAGDACGKTRKSERLDRLERLLEGLAHGFAQARMERAEMQRSTASENSSAESSVFSQFLAAHRPRARADSLSEAMGINPPYQRAQPQQTYLLAQQQVQYQQAQPQPPEHQLPPQP
ncbi:hypothetical protein PI124_g1701 [Phytophthora idaei]|nr:hypothetical protein PI125_g6615 [Phytophthora idaei]KAG3253742.1 hypothetical protein PI124_g1701 [Phytophthora idaei]